jgi:hypothetical protein
MFVSSRLGGLIRLSAAHTLEIDLQPAATIKLAFTRLNSLLMFRKMAERLGLEITFAGAGVDLRPLLSEE